MLRLLLLLKENTYLNVYNNNDYDSVIITINFSMLFFSNVK